MKRGFVRTLAAAVLLAVTVALVAWIGSSMSREGAQGRDFIAYWAAGQQLTHGADPYNAAQVLQRERAAGFTDPRPNMLLNLPIAFFLALPLGFISAGKGLVLWLLVLLACLMASVHMLWWLYGKPGSRLHLLCYLFAPVLACLMAGQLGTILLLGIVLFLYFYRACPFLAGAAFLLYAIKPHLFVPFGLVLLVWAIRSRAWRLLAGIAASLAAGCLLAYMIDPRAWTQYAHMMNSTSEVRQDLIPTVSQLVRLLIDRNAVWLQFIPTVLASAWALWYFWTRRDSWDWLRQGLLVLLVSEFAAAHAWFTDETVLLPVVLAGVYRLERSGRSLLPFAFLAGIALIEVLMQAPLTSFAYVWTAPAWLAWYLYSTAAWPRDEATPPGEFGSA